MLYKSERRQMLAVIEDLRCYNLIECTGGALSIRCSDDHVLITSTGAARRRWHLTDQDFTLLDLEGNEIETSNKIGPIGTLTHLAIYALLPNSSAIIHTHSTYSLVFASLGRDIPPVIDAMDVLGEVPCLHAEDIDFNDWHSDNTTLNQLFSNISKAGGCKYTRIPAINQLMHKVVPRQPELQAHGLAFLEVRHGIYAFASDINEAFTTLARVEAGAQNYLLAKGISDRQNLESWDTSKSILRSATSQN